MTDTCKQVGVTRLNCQVQSGLRAIAPRVGSQLNGRTEGIGLYLLYRQIRTIRQKFLPEVTGSFIGSI